MTKILTITGACHNDDFFYWGALKKEVSAEDRKIVDMLVKLWSNFAKYGYVFFRQIFKVI